jgi:hypothetical protein
MFKLSSRRQQTAENSMNPGERSPSDLRRLAHKKTFVVTSAVNNCPPEAGFLAALQRYCTAHDAELVVIPIRYINPTTKLDPQDGAEDGVVWDQELAPYLMGEELVLSDDLVIQGDLRIQATARNPLASLASRSRGRSAIFGSSQLAMQTVATPHQHLPKLLYTTGAVTAKRYSNTKAGNLANFHHSHSAIVVELRGKRFFMREITWDGEAFIDLGARWTDDGIGLFREPTLALVTGDEHVWFNCPKTRKATYGQGGIVETLQPDYIVRHDVNDSYSISHHHLKNSITMVVKTLAGMNNLRAELDDSVAFINDTTPSGTTNIIVASNHHEHITQWLRAGEKNVDPINAEFYHWLKYKILKAARMTERGVVHPDPFALYAADQLTCDTKFLGPDDSFHLGGVELGMHGHLGPNGSRGSLKSLSVIGSRFIIGHTHTPGIYEGGYCVGTSSNLRLEYNAGPSSWLNTHAALYQNGKRQLIHVFDGRWRG